MTTAKTLRQTHRFLAPIMLLPLVLTALTGSFYQLGEMIGNDDAVEWLIHIHKGDFGILDLQGIYPFLNALGLLVLVGTGITMWLQPKKGRFQKRINPPND
ncbi:PepSY domain-containing protein [Almyronema epifaneia]|uniref:PepSY domain-containing protein n=1 Tax=Almyronema epifaneia S1 TaxID=2991925 RepID=A0ABW6ID71_9CYAN